MNCPYCDKYIPGLTGLQELTHFQSHLRTCKKHPDRQIIVSSSGMREENPPATLLKALDIRHESGQ